MKGQKLLKKKKKKRHTPATSRFQQGTQTLQTQRELGSECIFRAEHVDGRKALD